MQSEKKIKIVYFLSYLQGAATVRWAVNIVDNLDRKKYAISFIGGKVEDNFRNGIPKNTSVVSLNSLYTIGLFFKLIKYFRKEQPDIFVSAYPHINTISVMAKVISMSKTKIVIKECITFSLLSVTARNFNRRFIARFILPHFMRVFYPLADAIICVSEGVAKDLFKIINYQDKIKIIYNPITNNKIYKLSKESVNHPWFLNSKTPIILAAGRLVKQKDYPTLLKAFKLVVQKQPVRLVILGEGRERKKLEKFSQKLKISENVVFLGFQKNPYKYMKRASVFVLSSLQEGFGNVIVEAMACGTPVVATDCKSGPGEIIENNKNGILVPVADYEALSEAILKVLNNASLKQGLSERGRERVKYFSSEKSIKKYEEVFQKLK